MCIRVDAIQSITDISEFMSILQIQQTTTQDEHLQYPKNIIITGWPNTKDQLHIDIRPYWSNKDDLAVIDSVVMTDRHIIILESRYWTPLHVNHVVKTKLFTCKSLYWVRISKDIENHVKNVAHALNDTKHSPMRKPYTMTYC